MLPVKDDLEVERPPVFSVSIIVVCGMLWLAMLGMGGPGVANFIGDYALVPARFLQGEQGWWTPLTSIFLHSGWVHIVSNLIFFWIVADNVEDELGHGKFLFVFLMSGLAASMAQILAAMDSEIPMVGASGAIGGIMGAFWVLFPKSKIETIIPNLWLLGAVVVLDLLVGGLGAMGIAGTPVLIASALLSLALIGLAMFSQLVGPVYWVLETVPTAVFAALFGALAAVVIGFSVIGGFDPMRAIQAIVMVGMVLLFFLMLSWIVRRLGKALSMTVNMPTPLFIGIWLVYNFVAGVIWLQGVRGPGVAYWAHVGGLVMGALLTFLLGRKVESRALRWSLGSLLTLAYAAGIAITYLHFPV